MILSMNILKLVNDHDQAINTRVYREETKNKIMKALDEKGFVFMDDLGRPFWCRMCGDQPWFMYWHKHQKSWVTLRAVNQSEVFVASQGKISDEQAQCYHDLHDKFTGATAINEKLEREKCTDI